MEPIREGSDKGWEHQEPLNFGKVIGRMAETSPQEAIRRINIVGAPGFGKSTLASGVFHSFRTQGYCCELVTEEAKDWAWRGETITDIDAWGIAAEQCRRESTALEGGADFVIADTSLLLNAFYHNTPPVMAMYQEWERRFPSLLLFLGFEEDRRYETAGRFHSERESLELESRIQSFCQTHHKGTYVEVTSYSLQSIVQTVRELVTTDNC